MSVRDMATLAELDLERVLGLPVSSSVVAGIVALDDRLDRLERGPQRNGWSVGSGSRPTADVHGHPWSAIGRVLSYPAAADDLYELSVDVWRHEPNPLVVSTTVVVGCFCADDHEIHTAAERQWVARSGVEVHDGLHRAAATLESWVDLDPDGWRTRAGLPLGAAAVRPRRST